MQCGTINGPTISVSFESLESTVFSLGTEGFINSHSACPQRLISLAMFNISSTGRSTYAFLEPFPCVSVTSQRNSGWPAGTVRTVFP